MRILTVSTNRRQTDTAYCRNNEPLLRLSYDSTLTLYLDLLHTVQAVNELKSHLLPIDVVRIVAESGAKRFHSHLRLTVSKQRSDPNVRNAYWNGMINDKLDKELLLTFELFIYCIWKAKIRKTVPRARSVFYLLTNILSTIFSIKPDN